MASATGSASSRTGHIFLSHAGSDTQAARQFAEVLRNNGFAVWFDKDNLLPGQEWMPALEKAIEDAWAMLVYVGRSGVQAWVDREVRYGLVRNTSDPSTFRFIPVLGEGADINTLPAFVQQHQCADLRDAARSAEQIRRLVEVLRDTSAAPSIAPGFWTSHSPFRGLQTFRPEDAWLFFGRDGETNELLDRMGRNPVVVVTGNSGSGKSSLLEAGLIPALQRGRYAQGGVPVDTWSIATFRPSNSPFNYLADALVPQLAAHFSAAERAELTAHSRVRLSTGGHSLRDVIAAVRPASRVLLVADQFEELFTVVPDKALRMRYIETLLAAANHDGAIPTHLILSLRADFYSHCLDHGLGATLDANLYSVPRLGGPELRNAIDSRLSLADMRAEPGLIDAILNEAGTEPGNLALVEHALDQLWDKRTFTNDAYIRLGRLHGALGAHADAVYRDLRSPALQSLAKRVFLELVHLGEGAPDTRRRVEKADLLTLGDPSEVEVVIDNLASARLLTTSNDPHSPQANYVEVSHEALIREWPALRGWIGENREELRIQRSIEQDAVKWRELSHDSGSLLQGLRLEQAIEWRAKRDRVPPHVEEFLTASMQAKEEAEARNRRTGRRILTLTYALGAVAVVAVAVVGVAFWQRRIAESRALAAESGESLRGDRAAALSLGIRAWERWRTEEARLAVARSFPTALRTFEHVADVNTAAFSPNGDHVVTTSKDGTVRIWSIYSGLQVMELEKHPWSAWDAKFSPNGKYLVTNYADGVVRLWDALSGMPLHTLNRERGGLHSLSFSPDSRRLLIKRYRVAEIWDVASGRSERELRDLGPSVSKASFSPDGHRIVAEDSDGSAALWDAITGERKHTFKGHRTDVNAVAFAPDGQRIVTASDDENAVIWDANTGQPFVELAGHSKFVQLAFFSPDNRQVLTASDARIIRTWNAATGKRLLEITGNQNQFKFASFSPDSRRILTLGDDRIVRLWNATTGRLVLTVESSSGGIEQASMSPNGLHIVTVDRDKKVRVWSTYGGELISKLTGHSDFLTDAAFAHDGQRIATASEDKTAIIWDVASGKRITELKAHEESLTAVALSPNGRWAVTGSDDGTARLWSGSGGDAAWTTKDHQIDVTDSSFSPDGVHFVTAGADRTARVWNIKDKSVKVLGERDHKNWVTAASYSGDGRYIATACRDWKARVFDAETGRLVRPFEGHTDIVNTVSFSHDGKEMVTASDDGSVRTWNIVTGQWKKIAGGAQQVTGATFAPDGRRLLVRKRHDNFAMILDATNGQALTRLDGHAGPITSASYSVDGRLVVTTGNDLSARVYRLLTLEGIEEMLQK